MEAEFHQLDVRYKDFRILDPAQQSKLMASLAQMGQMSPVLVVKTAQEHHYLLIDGYKRVEALRRIGQDTVRILELPMGEVDALLFAHELQKGQRRCVIEDAWFLRGLLERHGLTQQELARRLRRSRSWVCRRLALIAVLPDEVQDKIRKGALCPQVAMKYLTALARANRKACRQLVENLGSHPITVREMDKIYKTWRSGDKDLRKRVVEQPLLFLKADKAVSDGRDELPDEEDMEEILLKNLEALAGICAKVRLLVRKGVLKRTAWTVTLHRAWEQACIGFASLGAVLGKESKNAGLRHASCDPEAVQARCWPA